MTSFINGGASAAPPEELPPTGQTYENYPAMKDVYEDHFSFGIFGRGEIDGLIYNYASYTPGNEMKPENTQAEKGTFTFDAADAAMAQYSEVNPEMLFYGHTLAWHSQTPTWMWDAPPARFDQPGEFDPDVALENLNTHIDNVLGYYGEDLVAIDVVNEAIGTANPADWRGSLAKGEGWYMALGSDWVELAFLRAAEVVDDNGWDVKLVYNDFGLDSPAKARVVHEMVKDINERYDGVRPNGRPLIEVIGMQGHYNLATDVGDVEDNIKLFATLPGIEVNITEMDIALPPGELTEVNENNQGMKYAELFRIYREHAAGAANTTGNPQVITAVKLAGVRDVHTGWKGGEFAMPYDYDGLAKKALLGILYPDEFLATHDYMDDGSGEETEPVPGVHVYDTSLGDSWSGANIILGDDASQWPWAITDEDGEAAFTPEPDEMYRLSFNYTAKGTSSVRIRWIRDNSNGGYTDADGAVVNDFPYAADEIARHIPAYFNSGMVNMGSYTLVTEIELDGSQPAEGLIGNIAIRGGGGGNAFSINWITVERVGADGADDEVLVSWPEGTGGEEPGTDPEPAVATVDVDWSDERQRIDGFGGSFAFHKAGSIQRLGEPLASDMLDMVFDDVDGIGLDIVRVMVGDGGTWGDQLYDGPTDTIQPAPDVFVWDLPGWEDVKDDFDAYQIWLMQEAQDRGVETILASVWSPPAWMKENESVLRTTDGRPNRIRTDMYQEFADYLAEYVLGYEREFGIRITHVSPTNEPDLSTGYSSSEWSPQELQVFVRDHLGPTFEDRDIAAEIVLGEAVGFSERWVLPAITDPETEQYVDVVSAHAYSGLIDGGTRASADAFAASQELGKPIWQTEYMNQGAPRDNLFINNTITDGLRYAQLVGNLFNESGLGAYFWWWPVANNGADGSDLIRLVNDGSPQSGNPTETGDYRIFKRYYTLGQYSRFVDAGDVLLGSTSSSPEVTVTGFRDPDAEDFAVVIVNAGDEDVSLDLSLTGGFPDAALAGYRTSASENMVRLPDVTGELGEFTTTLRAGSVTTFVPADGALPGLPDRKDVFSTYPAAESDERSPGVGFEDVEARGQVATGLLDGDWIGFRSVNFADGSAAGTAEQKGELAMHVHVRSEASSRIEIRLGDPVSGPVVGTLDVPATSGEWSTVSTWIDTSEGAAQGFHDMYLVISGSGLDLDYAEFSDVGPEPGETPEPSPSPEPTESPEPSESPSPEPTESPDPSVSPSPTATPDPSASPSPGETPEPTQSPTSGESQRPGGQRPGLPKTGV